MDNKRDIQWFPGHMAKAIRQIKEQLKLVDLVIEVLDARIPLSSRNPDLNGIAQGKLRMIILAKADLADPQATGKWVEQWESEGIQTLAVDARNKKEIQAVVRRIDALAAQKQEIDAKRGIRFRPLRALVAGIPNVGKSTLINSLSARAVAKTGNRPGITKGQQWIKTGKNYELLDTPGLLWPKFTDQKVGEHLAMIGTMPDSLELMPAQDMANAMIDYGMSAWPQRLKEDYGIDADTDRAVMMEQVAEAICARRSGGLPDTDKAASVIIDRFRKGALGPVSLERVE